MSFPLLQAKDHRAPSLFEPANLLREARRQKDLPDVPVPAVALLDPDGDIVRHLARTGQGRRHPGWACYHTDMWTVDVGDIEIGVVGVAVGAPFAVLVAEQLAVSGAELVISITSAGQITPVGLTPTFIVIDRALRDEGTSHHYLPTSEFVEAAPDLIRSATASLAAAGVAFHVGATWTTDAPFRETERAIEAARAHGVLAVEMEAAALYAFAQARGRAVLCLAHVTNAMAQAGDDFEKGYDNGARDALRILAALAPGLASHDEIRSV